MRVIPSLQKHPPLTSNPERLLKAAFEIRILIESEGFCPQVPNFIAERVHLRHCSVCQRRSHAGTRFVAILLRPTDSASIIKCLSDRRGDNSGLRRGRQEEVSQVLLKKRRASRDLTNSVYIPPSDHMQHSFERGPASSTIQSLDGIAAYAVPRQKTRVFIKGCGSASFSG